MLDAVETVLLFILPWSFVAKTGALALMWWHLRYRTVATGPLGERIDLSFRDQAIMSAFITWTMFLLSRGLDATEIDWPFVSLSLAGVSLWPWRTARSHFRVYQTYHDIAIDKEQKKGGSGVTPD